VAGEGLGLNTVKRIIQRHGGRVWLESEVGKGSRFFVALPREAFDIETVSA
jgi:two-component system OmpR family sensor kinase